MKTTSLLFATLALTLAAAGCGKQTEATPAQLEARLVQQKDAVCACSTQQCAMDAKGKAEQIQRTYSKLVAADKIPQAVVDNYDAMNTCYREVNEGKR
ncbi:MAG: hypothetical protein IPL61_33980 [Myxococcales bacterium]|nr:hypothetical protein [Myxococcales bacterium]